MILRSSDVNCDVGGRFRCHNGGSCNTTDNEFMCVCPAGYTGFFCEVEVDECLTSPCRNGATCINRPGDFYCHCPRGFTGSLCEEQTEVCSASTCFNGGTCIDSTKGYICSCPFGYVGERCQYQRHGLAPNTNSTNSMCVGCSSKAGNGRCDKECDSAECGYDGGECSRDPQLFKNCTSADYCAHVFRDGVCDKVCDNEACLFDGFDCRAGERRCSDHCRTKKRDGVCDEECNTRECEFDGGDCRKAPENILTGELSVVVSSRPGYFVANIPRFLRWLSNILHADARIKSDGDGLLIFQWKHGEVGRRITIGNQVSFEQQPNTTLESILVRIEIDVSQCTEKCFSDVEVVASFISASKDELESMNMTIYSAVAEKPKHRPRLFSPLLFTMACVALMVAVALIFIVSQRGSRKRKIVENAPVWMPPTELENKKAEEDLEGRSQRHVFAFGSAKKRRFDPSELKMLEDRLTPTAPRVYVLPKARKMEVVPSQIHLDASSSKPIALPLSPEDVNRRGPNGRTPLMLLARNTMKLDRQLIEDANKLHSAGADLNLCDDNDDTALHMAVACGHVGLVRKLLQLGASPVIRDRTNSTCLHLAARACASSMVKALLEVEEMRQQVDEVDDENRTALMLVAMHDVTDTAIAEMLCDAGAEVDYDGDNNLTTWRGRTALHFAAKYDNTKMVTYLLKRSANKDCQDYECCTPLHLAAAEGNVGPVTELLKSGASVMLRNDKNQTPYDVALVNNRQDVAALLASGDNLRVQLYANHGEIFASSTPPSFKCAKVMMARHSRNARAHTSRSSPRSTQSTPTRCPATSPYNPMATPHSVAAFGSTYPSPQYPGHPMKLADGSAFGAVTSPRFQPSATEFSPAQYLPVNWSDTGAANGVVYSPHYHEEQVFFASVEKTVVTSPGYYDSGFVTMSHNSGCDQSTSWPPTDFPRKNESAEPSQMWPPNPVTV